MTYDLARFGGMRHIQPLNTRMTTRFDSEDRIFILKYYWKCENAAEVQTQFRNEFQREGSSKWVRKLVNIVDMISAAVLGAYISTLRRRRRRRRRHGRR
nr:hypothetical transcript [Hymenolepis microstoma]